MKKLFSLLSLLALTTQALGAPSNYGNIDFNNGAGMERQYIKNGNAQLNTLGWTPYADLAGTAPVDCTGGASTNTWTRSTTAPLRGTANFLLTKGATNTQGNGVSTAFTIDRADMAKPHSLSFDYEVGSGVMASADQSIWIYDVTNAVLIQPSAYTIQNAVGQISHKVEFQTASNSTSYRACIHTGSASAAAYTVKFANVKLSPNTFTSGSIKTDPVAYTPTFSAGFGSVSAVDIKSHRDGSFLVIEGNFTIGGPVTVAAGTMTLGYNGINGGITTATQSGTFKNVGNYVLSGSNARHGGFILSQTGVNYLNVADGYAFSGTIADAFSASGVNNWAVPGQIVSLSARVQIAGWGVSQNLSSETDTRVVSAIVRGNPQATYTANTAIIFPTITKDASGSYSTSTGEYTAPIEGWYDVTAFLSNNAAQGNTVSVYVDGVQVLPLLGLFYVVGIANGATQVYVTAGQKITLRSSIGWTAVSTGNGMTISRRSGPAQVAASEKIKAKYKVAASHTASTTAPVQFNTKIYDSHGAVTTGASWKFTAPRADNYRVSVVSIFGTGAPSVAVYKNGAVDSFIGPSNATSLNSGYTEIDLLAGDYIDIRPDSALTAASDNFRITVSAN